MLSEFYVAQLLGLAALVGGVTLRLLASGMAASPARVHIWYSMMS